MSPHDTHPGKSEGIYVFRMDASGALERVHVVPNVADPAFLAFDSRRRFLVSARQLRSFLDRRRDPNVPLRILDFTPIYIDVAAIIDVKDNYPRQATLAAAQAAAAGIADWARSHLSVRTLQEFHEGDQLRLKL